MANAITRKRETKKKPRNRRAQDATLIQTDAAKRREQQIKKSLEHKLYKLYYRLESRVAKLEARG